MNFQYYLHSTIKRDEICARFSISYLFPTHDVYIKLLRCTLNRILNAHVWLRWVFKRFITAGASHGRPVSDFWIVRPFHCDILQTTTIRHAKHKKNHNSRERQRQTSTNQSAKSTHRFCVIKV